MCAVTSGQELGLVADFQCIPKSHDTAGGKGIALTAGKQVGAVRCEPQLVDAAAATLKLGAPS